MLSRRSIIYSMVVLGVAAIIFLTWRSRSPAAGGDEEIARTYCGSCHVFPEPDLLTKQVWVESVIPQMAFRMGFPNSSVVGRISPADMPVVMGTVPAQPTATQEELDAIFRYYGTHAPDELILEDQHFDSLTQFDAARVNFNIPFLTMLKVDTIHERIFIGTQSSWLFSLDKSFKVKDSLQLDSPPSHAIFTNDHTLLTLLGILMPNDEAKGKLVSMSSDLKESNELLDSLKRPVFFSKADMNGDGSDDYVVCAYGNYVGNLTLYESQQDKLVPHRLAETPGAIRLEVRDFDGDGRKDILALFAQGDERLVLYTNKGNFNFEEKLLVRFPPVYGSNYFEVDDFNKDGSPDILFTNGDNGDYSIIAKPYHGVRIFENDGNNNFKQTMFFPMRGASQAIAKDFDNDGDLDIAAISFFTDFDDHPERSFIYLQNSGSNSFTPQTTLRTGDGRWLVMATWDYDQDGDEDIFLGSASYRGLGANNDIYRHWMEKATPVMMLENKLYSKSK